MNNQKYSYSDKINAICSYFGVSETAAKYMFHRRRRGYPFKKESDQSFRPWTIQLQNALISADKDSVIEWEKLKFDNDVKTLFINGIDVDIQPTVIRINKVSQTTKQSSRLKNNDGKFINEDTDDGGEWTVVSTNKGQLAKKHMLRTMGFLPMSNVIYKKSTNKSTNYTKK